VYNLSSNAKTINKILLILSREEKKSLLLNIFLSIGYSAVEAIALGSMVFFIKIASDISVITENRSYIFIKEYANEINPIFFLKILAGILIVYYLIRGLINLFYSYRIAKFSETVYASLSLRLLNTYLKTNYENFTKRGPVYINKVLITDAYNFTHVISACLIFLSEIFLISIIIAILAFTNLTATISIVLFLSITGIISKKLISKKISKYGVVRDSSQTKYYEFINTIFRNYKYFKVTPVGRYFLNEYTNNLGRYANASTSAVSLSIAPRVILEFLGFTTIVSLFLIVLQANDGSLKESIPIVSMFALGLIRMLPSVNRILTSYNQITFHKNTINTIFTEIKLNPELISNQNIEWKTLKFKNIEVVSLGGTLLISNGTFEINRGEKIGIIGDSGSGKTTLVDVILGIHQISKGEIFCDDKIISNNLSTIIRSKASYIPQSVHLFKGSIKENIAMGNQINENKMTDVLSKVDLEKLSLESDIYESQIKDSGIGVSGGQAQRIGIARAIYSNAEILIFDEPTSAIDEFSSIKIIQEIFETENKKTILLITHQDKLLDQCDTVYKICNNTIKKINKKNK